MKKSDITELLGLIRMYCSRAWEEGYQQGKREFGGIRGGMGEYGGPIHENPYEK